MMSHSEVPKHKTTRFKGTKWKYNLLKTSHCFWIAIKREIELKVEFYKVKVNERGRNRKIKIKDIKEREMYKVTEREKVKDRETHGERENKGERERKEKETERENRIEREK